MKYDLWGEPVDIETKKCSRCGVEKNISDFHLANGAKYTRSSCAECENSLMRTRKLLREQNKHSYPKDDYKCPICLRTTKEVEGLGGKKSGSWCCDHNHKTHKFRGWLCHDCNRALGGFKENEKYMLRAIEWLKKHET